MYLAVTSVKWYTWNASNRKLLHIIMCNLAKPMTINHKEVYAVNYKLALQVPINIDYKSYNNDF